jgi:hypothetical protein
MTVIQKQAVLFRMGHLPLSGVDGIWGDASKEATRAMQRQFGLEDDGIWGKQTDAAVNQALGTKQEQTGTFWDEIEYFTREEFRCQCGGRYCNGFPAEPQEELVRTVDEIRRRLGIPVTIGSGIRDSQHNANVGGVATSRHQYGDAADLYSAESPEWMAAIAEDVLGNTGGLGIYSWGIHVDTGKFSRWRG